MKNIHFLIPILIVILFISCRSKEISDEPAARIILKQAMVAGSSKQVIDAEIPEIVLNKFKTDFPGVSKVIWNEYKPEPIDDLDLSEIYYYASFEFDGVEQSVWYSSKGNWVKTSTKLRSDDRLPEAVMRTIQDLYPGYEVQNVTRENDERGECFDISLQKDDFHARVKLLPDGTQYKRKD